MRKVLLTLMVSLVMLFACEKESTAPAENTESWDTDLPVLKAASIDKNDVIVDQVKEALYGYFEGMEQQDYDLMRSLAHESFYALEQGVLCVGVEEHISWFQSLNMPPPGAYHFELDIVEVFVKGNVAWVIYYDALYMGDMNVWNGLESTTFLKTNSVWKCVKMTVTNLNPCGN